MRQEDQFSIKIIHNLFHGLVKLNQLQARKLIFPKAKKQIKVFSGQLGTIKAVANIVLGMLRLDKMEQVLH